MRRPSRFARTFGRPVAFHAVLIGIFAALLVVSTAEAQPADLAPERFTLMRGGHELMLPYAASHPLTQENEDVKHIAVMVHGVLRNTNVYHRFMDQLWRQQNDKSLAVLSPQFIAMEEVKEHDLDERYPYWTSGGWSIGHLSRSDEPRPRNPHPRNLRPQNARISSFEMFDEMLLAAARVFPNLERITVAGHSAGGQFVNRYAATNRAEPLLAEREISVRYIVSNPSSYLYFCENRLTCHEERTFGVLENNGCAMLNQYRYGLAGGINAYLRETGIERIPGLYASRRVTYLLGEADNDPEANRLDRGCGAMAQGASRFERGLIYFEYLVYRFGEEIRKRHRVVTVPGVGHSAARMFGSERGRAALFGKDETSTAKEHSTAGPQPID